MHNEENITEIKSKLQTVIEYILYLFIFILPWQTRLFIKKAEINGGYFEYGTYSLYASDILFFILFFLSLVYIFTKRKAWLDFYKNKNKKIKIKKYYYALALLDLFAFVSVFVASNHYLAFYKYVYFLSGAALFTLMIYFPYKKTKAITVFALSLVIQAMIALAQFFTQISSANKYLGIASHDPINLGVSVVEGMGNLGYIERWLRAYGSLDHPNILGGFLVTGLLVVVSRLIIKSKKIHLEEKDDFRREIFKINIFIYPAALLVFIAMFFSFSRAAWLASAIFFFLFALIAIFKKDKLIQKYFLPIFLCGGIVIFLVSLPFGNLIEARLKGQGRLEYISKVERINSAYSAKGILADHFFLGAGIGNYTIVLKEDYKKDEKSYYYQPTHNVFLLLWSEIGLFGLIAFVFFVFFVFFEGISKNKLIYKISIFSSFIVLLFFDHWWWSLHFGILYFFLFCSFIVNLTQFDNKA